MMKLVLASASPRRAQVLSDAGIRFETLTTQVDETRLPGESVDTMVCRLAEAKALAAAARFGALQEPVIVIGADTAVELAGEVLGKPGSAEIARHMLERLSGKTHRVLTGLAILRLPDGLARFEVECTQVRFAPLTGEEIMQYVATGEPLDKAGAYGIQGVGGRFVEGIEGCYFNVVGLPLARVYRLLKSLGWHPPHS
jgi:nucleoside triphosphate pyrophosphatase